METETRICSVSSSKRKREEEDAEKRKERKGDEALLLFHSSAVLSCSFSFSPFSLSLFLSLLIPSFL